MQQAVKRTTKVNIALGALRHLRLAQMRQLHQACVTPAVDCASAVWRNPLKDKTHLRVLGTVQRAALIRILSAFKTATTQPLEVKTYVLPARLRLKKRAYKVVVSLSEVSLWTGVVLLLPQRLNHNLGMSLQPAQEGINQ